MLPLVWDTQQFPQDRAWQDMTGLGNKMQMKPSSHSWELEWVGGG